MLRLNKPSVSWGFWFSYRFAVLTTPLRSLGDVGCDRHRRALHLIPKRKVFTFVQGSVNRHGKLASPLPNFKVFKGIVRHLKSRRIEVISKPNPRLPTENRKPKTSHSLT
jgi:hypothetical protein